MFRTDDVMSAAPFPLVTGPEGPAVASVPAVAGVEGPHRREVTYFPPFDVSRAGALRRGNPRAVSESADKRHRVVGAVLTGVVFAVLGAGSAYAFESRTGAGDDPHVLPIAVVVPLVWLLVVAINRGYDGHLVGHGRIEYMRVLRSFVLLAAAVAVATPLLPPGDDPRHVMIVLSSLLVTELLWRAALAERSRRRACVSGATGGVDVAHPVLAIGNAADVATFARTLLRNGSTGMLVRGACAPTPAGTARSDDLAAVGVTHWGGLDDLLATIAAIGARTVAIVSPDAVGPELIRRIRWQLEATDADLVVAPCLDDVALGRLQLRTVAGLPVVHVTQPDLRGPRRALVAAFDRLAALTVLGLLAPLLLGVFVAVRTTSRGPALFRQTRVGRGGRTFTMLKFRSMYRDAEDTLAALAEQNVHGDGVLFKVYDDPRVTRVGRVLRRYSLDELPQLFNVLVGHMALVGPRPPLPSEVLRYPAEAHRRLLVRPGLTGLWQVSGRSDLSWEESVRLDLRYIDNWSPALDLRILWTTPAAVVRGSGAY